MVPNEKPDHVSEDGSYSTRPTLPPSYSELFQRQHEEGLDASRIDSNSAVVLRVTRLDDTGKPAMVQWKYVEEPVCNQHYGPIQNPHGYGIMVTALFIIGEMVGGGIISMPNALCRMGWAGVAVIVIIGTMSGYTGLQLGRCWMLLQERWPEVYRHHTQKPYPEIGYRAGGVWCRRLVSLCMNLSLIGTATVFLLIVGQNVQQLLHNWTNTNISFCYFALIVAGVLLPVTYLGSPKDFWPVSFGAAISTTIAVIIMIIGMSTQWQDYKKTVTYPKTNIVDFILGYGTVMFAYSGQPAFPTIQHDMKNPYEFSKAVTRSYAVIFFYYLPVTILGFVVYGTRLEGNDVENVLGLLPGGWMQDIVTILITLHVMFGYIIFINPVNQEVESLLRVPARFSVKRVIIRTVVAVFVAFLAESIPAMNLLLDLVGGTAMAFLAFVFPGAFYLILRWRTTVQVTEIDKPIRKWEYLVTGVIILIGILGAIGSVYAFIDTVAQGGDLFKKPCYVNGGVS